MDHDQATSVRPRWRPPEHRIRVCKLTSCQPDGGSELMQALEERLGIKVDERTPDGRISLEALECVGLCDIPQSANIDDEPVMGLESVLRFVDGLLAEGSPDEGE
jgi:NADH:ubiquinone oxidoreductase subunit E